MDYYRIPENTRVEVLRSGDSKWRPAVHPTTQSATFSDKETEIKYQLLGDGQRQLTYDQRVNRKLNSHKYDILVFSLPHEVVKETGLAKIRVSRSKVMRIEEWRFVGGVR